MSPLWMLVIPAIWVLLLGWGDWKRMGQAFLIFGGVSGIIAWALYYKP